jgi:hypothetical protein
MIEKYIHSIAMYSFYYGSVIGMFKFLSLTPRKINLKRFKYAEHFISECESLMNSVYYILKYGATYSLISVTFPISVPLLIYLYNEDEATDKK